MKHFFTILFLTLFIFNCPSNTASEVKKNPFLETIKFPEEVLTEDAVISVGLRLPKEHEYNPAAPFTFEILKSGQILRQGVLKDPEKELPLSVRLDQDKGRFDFQVHLEVPYCSKQTPKLCKFKSIKLTQPVLVESNGKSFLKLETQL